MDITTIFILGCIGFAAYGWFVFCLFKTLNKLLCEEYGDQWRGDHTNHTNDN